MFLKKFIHLITLFSVMGFMWSCISPDENTEVEKLKLSDSIRTYAEHFPDSIPDFIELSKEATISNGAFQDIPLTDSAGPYTFKECYGDIIDFELVIVDKDRTSDEESFFKISKAYDSRYKGYKCFAFIYPMADPETADNYHADNTPYPVLVKAYHRDSNNVWNYIGQQTASNLAELSQYKVDCIYAYENR